MYGFSGERSRPPALQPRNLDSSSRHIFPTYSWNGNGEFLLRFRTMTPGSLVSLGQADFKATNRKSLECRQWPLQPLSTVCGYGCTRWRFTARLAFSCMRSLTSIYANLIHALEAGGDLVDGKFMRYHTSSRQTVWQGTIPSMALLTVHCLTLTLRALRSRRT